ncbi:MAG TPA: hypothetical protein VGJ20_36545 [Xanthobacteraceae bacterium]|jgi:hypothetical protein
MTVSEFSRNRPSSNEPRLTRARLWLGKLISFAVARALIIFLLGVAAGIAWQSYGADLRKAIASLSPHHLAWLAPTSASAGASADRLRATSLALAGVRQSVDKLASEISQLQEEDSAPRRRRR